MDPQVALAELAASNDLFITTLAQPILCPEVQLNRTSNASTSSDGNLGATTPALLQADLQHYRDLFSKLRFSYVEQVTKEKFLRAITSDPPQFVDVSENAELEGRLRSEKEALKQKKEEVANLVGEVGEQAQALAQRYEVLQLQTTRLESLPAEIEDLQAIVDELQASQHHKSSNTSLCLPLQPTLEILSERERELSDLDVEIEHLRSALPAKRREIETLQDEMKPLRLRKENAVKGAQEARRLRVNGGTGEELEERGRWLRSVDAGLRTMLAV